MLFGTLLIGSIACVVASGAGSGGITEAPTSVLLAPTNPPTAGSPQPTPEPVAPPTKKPSSLYYPAHPFLTDEDALVFDASYKYYFGLNDCLADVNTIDENAGPRPSWWPVPAWPMNWGAVSPSDGCMNIVPISPNNAFYLGGASSIRLTCTASGDELRQDVYNDWDCTQNRGAVIESFFTKQNTCYPYYPTTPLEDLDVWYRMEWAAGTCSGYPLNTYEPTSSPTTSKPTPPPAAAPTTGETTVVCPEPYTASADKLTMMSFAVSLGVLLVLLWKTFHRDFQQFYGAVVLPVGKADEHVEELRTALRQDRRAAKHRAKQELRM